MDRAEALKTVKKLEKVAARATHQGEADAARNRASHLRAQFKLSDNDVANASEEDGYSRFNYYVMIQATFNGIKTTLDHTKREIDKLNTRDRADAAVRLYEELHKLVDLGQYPPSLKKWRNEAIKARYQVEVDKNLAEWVSEEKPELDNLHSRAYAHDWALTTMADSHLRRSTIEHAVGVFHKDLWDRYVKAANNAGMIVQPPTLEED